MDQSLRSGMCFGMTSGIITTLGLMVGLEAGTNSVLAVIGGIITIAVADAFSDSLGIHISQESAKRSTHRQVWRSTFSTFLTKFIVAASFIIPILLLDLYSAILASVAWGALLLGTLSFYIAREKKVSAMPVIAEHIGIALAVVVIAHFLGKWVSLAFV